MASMQDFAPGGRFYYSGQYDDPPPWKKKKSSLFWEDQLERQSEIRDDPSSNLGFFGLNYSDMPWPIQKPMEWFKKQVLEGEARDARISKGISDVVGSLGESMSEREARLDKERMEAAAKKQEIAQAERRMPYPVAPTPKIEEDEDNFNKLLAYMFIRDIIGGTAGGDPPTPYTVRAGPAARAFPTMPSMFG